MTGMQLFRKIKKVDTSVTDPDPTKSAIFDLPDPD